MAARYDAAGLGETVPHFNRRIETLDHGRLEDIQVRLLRDVLEAAGTNPFWSRRLGEAGLEPERISSLSDLSRLSLVRKADLLEDQRAHPPFGSRFHVDEVASFRETSGTSGHGQEIHAQSTYEFEASALPFAPMYRWAGLQPGDRLAQTMGLSLQTGGQVQTRGAERYGLNVLNLAPYPSEKKLALIKRYQPHGLVATPSYVNRLRFLAREMGIDFRRDVPSLRAAFIAAEPYSHRWAEDVQAELGLQIISEQYGFTPVGVIAFSCEAGVTGVSGGHRNVLHASPLDVYMEILDPISGESVNYGETGEVVVTSLNRRDNPLIRYGSGDRARRMHRDACACGRAFDGIESGTVARFDDMMKVRGINLWPEVVDEVILSHDQVEEYRGSVNASQDGREQILIEVEFISGLPHEARPDLVASLSERVQEKIGLKVDLREAQERLPRFEFKSRRWHDRRSE